MSVRLADPALSRIVLIGTPTHVHADERLPDVPVVANNLTDLAAVFTDPKLGGFDAEHCVTATPGAGMPEIGEILTDAAENAKDLLLIYYAGHGLLDRRGHLHLALAGTHLDRLGFTALPYETLRAVCLDSAAKSKVVILDSCYSGRAIGQPLSGADQVILPQLEATGTYTLTSAPANHTARILPGEQHTAFTGRMLALMLDGHPALGEVLTMGDIYRRLHEQLTADGLPKPQQRGTATADLIGLVRNRRPAPPAIAKLPEEIQEGLDSRFPSFRLAAVKELGEMLAEPDQARVRAAVIALRKVAAHDNPDVAGAARALLAGADTTVITASIKGLAQSAPPRSMGTPAPDWADQVRRLAGEAEQIARKSGPRTNRVSVWCDIARAWAIVDPETARRILANEAEPEKYPASDNAAQVRLLADIALAWATIDSVEAEHAAAEAEQIAVAIKRDTTGVALTEAVRGWAAVNPAKAEHLAKTIRADFARTLALIEVTRSWAATNPTEALRIAMTIRTDAWRAHALAEVARRSAPTDSATARLAVTEAERIVTMGDGGTIKAESLARVAIGWAAVDQVKARQLAAKAQETALSLKHNILKMEALVYVVRGWSAIDPAIAAEVATLIEGANRQRQALAAVAQGWATVDLAQAERVAKNLSVSSSQARTLAAIALALGGKAKLGQLPA